MPTIKSQTIFEAVYSAIRNITYHPDPHLADLLLRANQLENSSLAKDAIACILENHRLSPQLQIPLCQDTGTCVVFAELGNMVMLEEALDKTVNKAVEAAQRELPLRASMVLDPLFGRENSRNNSPAILHICHTEGERLILRIAQKGGGAENMSFMKMLTPAASPDDIIDFIVDNVINAGSRPCPPVILGIGIGGNFETAPLLAKRALFEPLGRAHTKAEYHAMEEEILKRVNAGGVGVQGFGGVNTALAVHILEAPCHIASLPVAVNVECHAHRHISIEVSRETN